MNKTTTINIRVDEATRRQLKDFANELGIPASSLVNASIRQMLRSHQATFSTGWEPTPRLQKLIKEAEADSAAAKNITRINNKEELEAYFDAL